MSEPDITEREIQIGNNDGYVEINETGQMTFVGDAELVLTGGKLPTTTGDVGETVTLTPGVGISGGTGTVFKAGLTYMGPLKKWTILIDLTGLNCGGTAGDVIGVNGAGAAYLCQINGTVVGGRMLCLEAPAGGNADIDLYAATEATGVEDVAISTLAETQLINGGAQSAGTQTVLAAVPTTGQYLYLTCGTSTDAAYTAGIFIIELFGY